jgi:hypothetical protein
MKHLFILAVAVMVSCSAMADYSWYNRWVQRHMPLSEDGVINYALASQGATFTSVNMWHNGSSTGDMLSGVFTNPGAGTAICAGGTNGDARDDDGYIISYFEISMGRAVDIQNVTIALREDDHSTPSLSSFDIYVSTFVPTDEKLAPDWDDFVLVTEKSNIMRFRCDRANAMMKYWVDIGRPDIAARTSEFYNGAAYNFALEEGVTYVRLANFQQPGAAWANWYAVGIAVHNVPEPATRSLLALGGLALLRRRRR